MVSNRSRVSLFVKLWADGLEPLAIESQESIVSPQEERETIMGLLEQIDVFIDAGGDEAKAWTELRYLLEHTLTDIEETTNQTEKF